MSPSRPEDTLFENVGMSARQTHRICACVIAFVCTICATTVQQLHRANILKRSCIALLSVLPDQLLRGILTKPKEG